MNILDMTKKRRGRVIMLLTLVLCLATGLIIGCTRPTTSGSSEDEMLRKFTEAYEKAEYTFALFTDHGSIEYEDETIELAGNIYRRVDLGSLDSLDALRELCLESFTEAFTDELMSTSVENGAILYVEKDGALWRCEGIPRPTERPYGDVSTIQPIERNEDGARLIVTRISAENSEMRAEFKFDVIITDDTLRFKDFTLCNYSRTFWKYQLKLADGSTKELDIFGMNPSDYANEFALRLDGSDDNYTAIINRVASGTGIMLDSVTVVNLDTGEVIPVTPVDEVLDEYVSFENGDDAWTMTVNNFDYPIFKWQFQDYPDLLDIPDTSFIRYFVVHDERLYCRVAVLCAGASTGFSGDNIVIHYDLRDGKLVPVELTVEPEGPKPESLATILDTIASEMDRFTFTAKSRYFADFADELFYIDKAYVDEPELVSPAKLEEWQGFVYRNLSKDEKNSLPQLVRAIRDLKIKRADLEKLMDARKSLGGEWVLTDEQIDLLYLTDDSEVRRALVHPLALLHEDKIYTWFYLENNIDALELDAGEISAYRNSVVRYVEPEEIVVTKLEDLIKLPIGEDDYRCEYIRAFINGETAKLEEICGVKKGMYDAYKSLELDSWQVITVPSPQDGSPEVHFSFTPKKSDDRLIFKVGETYHSMVCESLSGITTYDTHSSGNSFSAKGVGELELFLRDFANVIRPGDKYSAFLLTCYIVGQFDHSISKDELVSYAKTHFGVENFEPDSHKTDDGYGAVGHGGSTALIEIVDAKELASGETEVTVQCYADFSETVKSDLYLYRIRLDDGKLTIVSQKMLEKGDFPPCSWTM